MSQPFEIIATPFEVYIAPYPLGEAFPDVDTTPGSTWTLLGLNGNKNQEEAGVTVEHPQTINLIRTAGGPGPVKAARTEEDLIVTFTLLDLRPEVYQKKPDM